MNYCACEVVWGRNRSPGSATMAKTLIFTFCIAVTNVTCMMTDQPSLLRGRHTNTLVMTGVRRMTVRPPVLHDECSVPRSSTVAVKWERRVTGGVTIVSHVTGWPVMGCWLDFSSGFCCQYLFDAVLMLLVSNDEYCWEIIWFNCYAKLWWKVLSYA